MDGLEESGKVRDCECECEDRYVVYGLWFENLLNDEIV